MNTIVSVISTAMILALKRYFRIFSQRIFYSQGAAINREARVYIPGNPKITQNRVKAERAERRINNLANPQYRASEPAKVKHGVEEGLVDSADPRTQVQELKATGMTSVAVAKNLGMSLKEVNKHW